MASELTEYTDTDAVRGALALDADEIPDEMLVNQGLEQALLADLDDWLPTHADIWEDGFANDAEAVEIQRQRFLQLYSMWYCAARLAETYPSWPQQMTDGKMEIRRFQNLDFEKMIERARGYAEKYKRAMQITFGEATSAVSSTVKIFGAARADYDPVLGGADTR
jgi:hypothetical protein